MIKIFFLMLKLLSKYEKFSFLRIIILGVLSALLEILSIIFIVQVANLILDKEKFYNSKLYNFKYFFFRDYSIDQLIIIFSFVTIILIITRVLLSIFVVYLRDRLILSIILRYSTNIYNNFLKSDFKNVVNSNYTNEFMKMQNTSYIGTVLSSLIQFNVELIFIILISIFLLKVNFEITLLIFILFFPIIYLIIFRGKKILDKYGTTKRIIYSNNLQNIFRSFNLFNEIKLLKKEDYFKNIYYINKKKDMQADIRLNIMQLIPRAVLEIFLYTLFFFFTVYYFFQGFDINIISYAIIFVLSSLRILPGINKAIIAVQNINQHFSYVNEFIKNKIFLPNNLLVNKKTVNKKIVFNNSIELNNISFFYEKKSYILVKNNIKIKKNDIVGLIGESGSGKTTLINILLGLLKPTEGKILVDKKNIFKNTRGWQSIIGYTKQNSFLFNDTIEKNIALSLEELNTEHKEKILDLLKVCELEKLLVDKQNSYPIGEANNKISGGQAQRIGIARALFNNPELLILDEATSEIDKFTEKKILKNILNYHRGNITIFIVTHRLESIQKMCNKIYKLENAKLTQVK